MELSKILQVSAVKVLSGSTSKKRLFQELADQVAHLRGVCPKTALAALLEREALGPTGVGKGVALPHARMAGLSEVVGVFLKLEKSMDFDAVDRKPVDLVFALFAPENAGVDHLKALAAVSRAMRDSSVCAKLRANSDVALLHLILTEASVTKAA